jgi:glycosyltransferase involved in cell wall biosynthesis
MKVTYQPESLDLSIVVPIYNERDNIRPLVSEVMGEVGKLGLSYELILVNDGSSDGSTEMLDAVAGERPRVRVVHFKRNYGQTLAMAAGMHESVGNVIVTMDGDRQNDPADIGALLKKLDQGYSCVCGWRKHRQDGGLRKFVSRVANKIIHRLSRVPVHDLGCTLKAFRTDALDPRDLFGEMHRFLPQYVMGNGGSVGEMVVNHRPRTAGESKYGFSRIYRVISDIILIRVLHKYRTRPSHMFAKIAQYMVMGGGGLFMLGLLLQLVFGWSTWAVGFLSALILSVGAVGLLAAGAACELIMRNRYQLADERPWAIGRRVNFDIREQRKVSHSA